MENEFFKISPDIFKGKKFGIKWAEFYATYYESILRWRFIIDSKCVNEYEPRIYSHDILALRNLRPKKWTDVCEQTFTWKDYYNSELDAEEANIYIFDHEALANGTLILGKPVGNRVPISIQAETDLGDGIYRISASARAEFTGVHFLDRDDHIYTLEEVAKRLGPQFELSEYDLASRWNEHGRFYWNYLFPKAIDKKYRENLVG